MRSLSLNRPRCRASAVSRHRSLAGPSTEKKLRNGHAFGDATESPTDLSGTTTISLPIMHRRYKSAANELNLELNLEHHYRRYRRSTFSEESDVSPYTHGADTAVIRAPEIEK